MICVATSSIYPPLPRIMQSLFRRSRPTMDIVLVVVLVGILIVLMMVVFIAPMVALMVVPFELLKLLRLPCA